MLNGKYVEVSRILENVSRDFGFQPQIQDVVEWIWTIVGLIGLPDSLYDDAALIEIENYRGALPANFYELSGEGAVRDYYSKEPLIYMTNTANLLDANESAGTVVYSERLGIHKDENGVEDDVVLINLVNASSNETNSYKITGDYIYTGFKEGKIEIQYKAFPADANGLPLVPEDPQYIRAVTDYIGERMAFRAMLRDEISERKYMLIKQQYTFSIGAARTKGLMPSIDKMEALKNRSYRLINTNTEHRGSFKYMGDPQLLRRI